MKIFAIYSDVKLTKKPDWLDDFRGRYNATHDYHVTLKQPTYIEENDVQTVKDRLAQIVHGLVIPQGGIALIFDTVVTDTDDQGISTIMINAQKNEALEVLQKSITLAFKHYGHFYNPDSQNWEENFQPHITIGDGLNGEQLKLALAELKQGLVCVGIIENVVLSIVDNMSLEEIQDPANKTIYKLS